MDNLGVISLIVIFLFLLWAVLVLCYIVLEQHKELKELRQELARYTQPQEPEWVKWLFRDTPSDPRMGIFN